MALPGALLSFPLEAFCAKFVADHAWTSGEDANLMLAHLIVETFGKLGEETFGGSVGRKK